LELHHLKVSTCIWFQTSAMPLKIRGGAREQSQWAGSEVE
jgi:hypothetical protein